MALIYRLFRHVCAPKDPALQDDPGYDFRRVVSSEGIYQGLALGRMLDGRGIKPSLVYHSESPRAIVTAHLACKDSTVQFIPLKEFWPSDGEFFNEMWDFAKKYQFEIQSYLDNPEALAIYREYGRRIADEIEQKTKKLGVTDGEILIFGHGVWNCFVAWALAGFPEEKNSYFVHLAECAELSVTR